MHILCIEFGWALNTQCALKYLPLLPDWNQVAPFNTIFQINDFDWKQFEFQFHFFFYICSEISYCFGYQMAPSSRNSPAGTQNSSNSKKLSTEIVVGWPPHNNIQSQPKVSINRRSLIYSILLATKPVDKLNSSIGRHRRSVEEEREQKQLQIYRLVGSVEESASDKKLIWFIAK